MIPDQIIAGTIAEWGATARTSPAGLLLASPEFTGTYWLRANAVGAGIEVAGIANGAGGWDFTILPATTQTMTPGRWFYEFRLIGTPEQVYVVQTGTLEILPALTFTGAPAAYDGRSQTELDLEAVRGQIRKIILTGTSQYGIAGRNRTMLALSELRAEERKLVGRLNRERYEMVAGESGADPRLIRGVFVR